jgi:hypothetical protein
MSDVPAWFWGKLAPRPQGMPPVPTDPVHINDLVFAHPGNTHFQAIQAVAPNARFNALTECWDMTDEQIEKLRARVG